MTKQFKLNIGGVTNWYDHFVSGDIELIAAYIEQCEISNNIALSEYHKYHEEEIIENEHGSPSVTIHFRGIDGSLFDAKDIYKNVFPMFNRHSTLIIVMSLFEKRLFQLCNWSFDYFELEISFKNKGKESLLRQIKDYLVLKAKLEFNDELTKGWNELMILQLIRNNIAHNFGKYERNNEGIDEFIKSNKNIHINRENEFVFGHEFLKNLVPGFNVLCKQIQDAIRLRAKLDENGNSL